MPALTAPVGVSKTAMMPSPVALTTVPSEPATAERTMTSCRSRAERIASGFRSHSRVLPTTSVKRNVGGRPRAVAGGPSVPAVTEPSGDFATPLFLGAERTDRQCHRGAEPSATMMPRPGPSDQIAPRGPALRGVTLAFLDG